jgi:hypothetical protein
MRELPITGAGMAERKFTAGDVAPLREVMDYPALYQAMPQIGETPVSFVTDRTNLGQAIARTKDDGFEMTAGLKNKHARRQLEKLSQYQINKEAGLSGSFRDSLDSKIEDMEDAISQARLAMQVGALSPETGRAYIQSLEHELSLINIAFAMSRTKPEVVPALKDAGYSTKSGLYPTPQETRGIMKEDLHRRGAGNNMARAAMARMTNRDDPYPLKPGERFVTPGNTRMNYIAPMGDQVVLPQRDMDVLELAAMLENWRRYGAGSGNR